MLSRFIVMGLLPLLLACCGGGGTAEGGTDLNAPSLEGENVPAGCSGTGRCFFIDSEKGSDFASGSSQSPWRTYLNLVSVPEEESNAKRPTLLKAGDSVIFRPGSYGANSFFWGERRSFFLRDLHGSPSSPIQILGESGAQISPSDPAVGIHLLNCSNLVIRGLTVTNSNQAGIWVEDSDNITLSGLTIRDTDGEDNGNIAGLYLLNSTNITLESSTLYDNFDRTNEDTSGVKTDNSRNVVIFGGGNIRILNNHIFQSAEITASKTGGCVTYKHSSLNNSLMFEVSGNTFENCYHTAIGTGTPNSWIHHNRIINSDPIAIRDFGGPTAHQNIIIEYNTVVGGAGLSFDPSDSWSALGTVTFRNNIILDDKSYFPERGIITIDTYGSDALYRDTLLSGKFVATNNCYWNSQFTPVWSAFAENGGEFGEEGLLFSFDNWRALGFGAGSHIIDPMLNGDLLETTEPRCENKGWSS